MLVWYKLQSDEKYHHNHGGADEDDADGGSEWGRSWGEAIDFSRVGCIVPCTNVYQCSIYHVYHVYHV